MACPSGVLRRTDDDKTHRVSGGDIGRAVGGGNAAERERTGAGEKTRAVTSNTL
jgi:hypothetical protein